jgi:hypothetical protein
MSRQAPHHRTHNHRWPTSRSFWIAALVLLMLVPSGCVRRRLMVRSNPPGALVYVDNQQIGTTPCSVDFTYYGTREIRLVKPGFETLTVNQPIPTPWYEVPPLDFFSENVSPTEIRDNRTVSYNLVPQVIVPTQQLLDRADQLRQQALQAPVAPAAGTAPIGTAVPGVAPAVVGPPTTPAPTLPPPATVPTPAPMYTPPTGAAPATSPPFTPPPLPAPSSQQGQPLVSPPLR